MTEAPPFPVPRNPYLYWTRRLDSRRTHFCRLEDHAAVFFPRNGEQGGRCLVRPGDEERGSPRAASAARRPANTPVGGIYCSNPRCHLWFPVGTAGKEASLDAARGGAATRSCRKVVRR
ncbi:unnamed protein product [Gadus morhua 'NCC']